MSPMYDFVFAFFYQYYRRQDMATPETSAVIAVAGLQVLHLVFLFGVCKRVFSLNLTYLAGQMAIGHMIGFIILLPLTLIALNFLNYTKNKRASILLKHQDTNLLVARNVLIVIGIFFIPLVLAAALG